MTPADPQGARKGIIAFIATLRASSPVHFAAAWLTAFLACVALSGMSVPLPEPLRLWLSAMIAFTCSGALLVAWSRPGGDWVTLLVTGVLFSVAAYFIGVDPSHCVLPFLERLSGRFASIVLSAGLVDVGLLGACVCFGRMMGLGLRRSSYVVLAVLVAAITDTYSVFSGPTKHLAASGAVNFMALQWAGLGTRNIFPVIGAGDFIFLSLFAIGARRFGGGVRQMFRGQIIAVGVGFFCVLVLKVPLPALPFMGAAFLITNGRRLQISRSDIVHVITLAVALAAVFGIVALKRLAGQH